MALGSNMELSRTLIWGKVPSYRVPRLVRISSLLSDPAL
jgi:hypothetical protein